jgi:predicted O-methyltransferase YrrM
MSTDKPKKVGRPKKTPAIETIEGQTIEQPIEQYALEPLTRHQWSAEDEVGSILAALIKCHNATNVLELGTLEGYTSKYMINAVNEIGGSFSSVDVEDKRSEEIKLLMNQGDHKFITGSSLQVCPTLPRGGYDLIYVDTIHEWHHALPEFKFVDRLIKQGGLLVYHDTIKFPDMKRLASYVKSFRYQSITIRTPEGNGLSIFQK